MEKPQVFTIADAVALARQADQAGQSQEAERICQEVLKVRPDYAPALLVMGKCALDRHDPASAHNFLEQARQADPHNAESHYLLGMAQWALKKNKEAAASLAQAVARDPRHAEALYQQGRLFLEGKELDQALRCLQQTLDLQPAFPAVSLTLTQALLQRGNESEARLVLEQAVRHTPNHRELWQQLAALWERQKEIELAAAAYCRLGDLCRQEMLRDEALAGYRQALRLQSDLPAACYGAALILREQKKTALAEATKLLRRALTKQPDWGQARLTLGATLGEIGEIGKKNQKSPPAPLGKVSIPWTISHLHGWGVYGMNLVFSILRRGGQPILLQAPTVGGMLLDPLQERIMQKVLKDSDPYIRWPNQNPGRSCSVPDMLLLSPTNGSLQLQASPVPVEGYGNVVLTFFENTNLPAGPVNVARDLPLIVTGSSWNENVLREKYGLRNVRTILQGVDTTLFHPTGRRQLLPGRFVIFSGGKFEHRKGQDLVLGAFKRFRARHPEAFLLSALNNYWLTPESMGDYMFNSPHIEDLPLGGAVNNWLAKHLPADSFYDIGMIANPMMASILREVDAAIFPNRCEGGTNLVAMECMASGLPVILAANTGQLDLVDDERCYVLKDQGAVYHLGRGKALMEDWGESSVDEIDAHLESIYQDRTEAARRGANAARFMAGLSWNHQCDRLLDLFVEMRSAQ